jgi:ribosomal protein S27E
MTNRSIPIKAPNLWTRTKVQKSGKQHSYLMAGWRGKSGESVTVHIGPASMDRDEALKKALELKIADLTVCSTNRHTSGEDCTTEITTSEVAMTPAIAEPETTKVDVVANETPDDPRSSDFEKFGEVSERIEKATAEYKKYLDEIKPNDACLRSVFKEFKCEECENPFKTYVLAGRAKFCTYCGSTKITENLTPIAEEIPNVQVVKEQTPEPEAEAEEPVQEPTLVDVAEESPEGGVVEFLRKSNTYRWVAACGYKSTKGCETQAAAEEAKKKWCQKCRKRKVEGCWKPKPMDKNKKAAASLDAFT